MNTLVVQQVKDPAFAAVAWVADVAWVYSLACEFLHAAPQKGMAVCIYFFFFFVVVVVLLGLYPRCMEVPRLGVRLER